MEKTDLTGFAALLGDSLTSRVGLLERLLQGAHYPSLGRYKEKLLADTIQSFIPKNVEVGTGFVLFPFEEKEPAIPGHLFDPINQSGYIVSRQCDVIVYDAARYPTVFRDGDFVVVRPEAVHAVIEVKGSLETQGLNDTLESFHDFALKWQNTSRFYKEHLLYDLTDPGLYLMAWDVKRTKSGSWRVGPARLAEKIAEFYAGKLPEADNRKDYPLMDRLLVHNEYEIRKMIYVYDESDRWASGWDVSGGKFVRVAPDGSLYRDKDRTVASLLAALHWNISRDNFNRYFSYMDEVKQYESALPYEHQSFAVAWSSDA